MKIVVLHGQMHKVSGQLKTLLDHLAYRWMTHRPHPKMFSKVGLVISTAAGAGTKKVTKSLKYNLFYWGVPKNYLAKFQNRLVRQNQD